MFGYAWLGYALLMLSQALQK
jgi:hypothetical protein